MKKSVPAALASGGSSPIRRVTLPKGSRVVLGGTFLGEKDYSILRGGFPKLGVPFLGGPKNEDYGILLGGFPKLGVPFFGGGPCNKDYSIWVSILGPSYMRKLPLRHKKRKQHLRV